MSSNLIRVFNMPVVDQMEERVYHTTWNENFAHSNFKDWSAKPEVVGSSPAHRHKKIKGTHSKFILEDYNVVL